MVRRTTQTGASWDKVITWLGVLFQRRLQVKNVGVDEDRDAP